MDPFTEDAQQWLEEALRSYAATRDVTLRDEIVAATSWLAARGARRFANRGEPLDDLVQVARIGLIKAVDRFDPAFGVRFAAFATPTIMGELRRHFRDHTWSVHVPRRAKDLRQSVNRAVDELSLELGRSPRFAEIAARVGVGEDAVVEALEANVAYRADALDPNGYGVPLADGAPLEDVLDREVIARLVEQLPPRDQAILRMRFVDELSQAQIAARIGTSQVHVGRLLASALARLRVRLDADDFAGRGA